ncbi:phytanoyl-CoA dioxygenase family protein [Limibacillus sp. MBR-115]|jgi:hypothetical protein|uniref:phytanoyl-CoA dioxygenase family protein n=1 Tax=Limibacillus sp. MBR-115 TaxID=3156465 RepID=UPI003394977B
MNSSRSRPHNIALKPKGKVLHLAYDAITGWALDGSGSQGPLEIGLFHEGRFLHSVQASGPTGARLDQDAPPGAKIFRLPIPMEKQTEKRRALSVRFMINGQPLENSPAETTPDNWVPPQVDFEQITIQRNDTEVPVLDRATIDEEGLSPTQIHWREAGYVILPKFMPSNMISAYCHAWQQRCGQLAGWTCPVPYMHVPEAMALSTYGPLAQVLESLIGKTMAVQLNLTGWLSTRRDWHQDSYLSRKGASWRLAIWIALEDIHPDSGPFEFVPGSHRWPTLDNEKVRDLLPQHLRNADWPRWADRFVVPACKAEICKRRARVEKFIARKGDVLIWHGSLLHRGAVPVDPQRPRKSFIAHYSALDCRPDFPFAQQSSHGGYYFPIHRPLD